MAKILVIEKCNYCPKFERNMYHGECCWHDNVATPHKDGKTPRKIIIRNREDIIYVPIPYWCPLENAQ